MAVGTAELQILINAKDEASGTFKKVGGALGKFAKVAAVGVGVLGVAAGAATVAAVKMAQGYEKAMKEVASLGVPAKQMKVLEKGVLDLSRRLGIDATEATGALYQAISAGVPPENALAFLETASKAAIAGVTDAETAVDGISSVVNAFASQNITATQAADLMFATVKAGKTNFEELSASIANVAPLANATGVQFSEVSAALATMTASGTKTAVATTQIRSAIQALTKPSEGLNDIFTAAGFASGEAAVRQLGFAKAAGIVSKATGGSVSQMTKLLGSIEGVQGVLGVTGDQADAFAANIEGMANSAGAADQAFDVMSQSFDFQMGRVRESFKTGLIEVGLQILPIITPIAAMLADKLPAAIGFVVEKVSGFIEVIGYLRNRFGDLRDAIVDFGSVMAMARGSIEQFGDPLGMLVDIFPELTGVLQPFRDLWVKLTPIMEPVGAAFRDIAANVMRLWEVIQPLIPTIVSRLLPAWFGLLSLAGKLLPILQAFGQSVLPTITNVISRLSAAWNSVFGGAVKEGPGLFAELSAKAKEMAATFGEQVVPFIEMLTERFIQLMPQIQKLAEEFQAKAKVLMDEVGPGLEMIGDVIQEQILPALEPFISLIGAVIKTLGALVEPLMTVIGALRDALAPIIETLVTEVLPVLLELWGEIATQFETQILPILQEVVEALAEALVPAFELISKVVIFLLRNVLIPIYEFLRQYILPVVTTLAKVLLTVLRDALRVIAKLLRGDFMGAFEAAWQLVSNLVGGVSDLFGKMADAAIGAVKAIIGAVRNMAREVRSAVKNVPVIGGVIGKLAGFQEGGQFMVGGAGGPDSQTVAFRATPGETVTVNKPGQRGGGGYSPTIVVQGSLISERELSEVIVESMREATRLNQDVLDVNAVAV
jgi:TP901 family phage tail tape measure protein